MQQRRRGSDSGTSTRARPDFGCDSHAAGACSPVQDMREITCVISTTSTLAGAFCSARRRARGTAGVPRRQRRNELHGAAGGLALALRRANPRARGSRRDFASHSLHTLFALFATKRVTCEVQLCLVHRRVAPAAVLSAFLGLWSLCCDNTVSLSPARVLAPLSRGESHGPA